MVGFIFNLGAGRLQTSTHRRRIKQIYEFIRCDEHFTVPPPKLPTMHSFINSAIRRYRNQRHLTLENVSGIAGMPVQHLSEIESSKRRHMPTIPASEVNP